MNARLQLEELDIKKIIGRSSHIKTGELNAFWEKAADQLDQSKIDLGGLEEKDHNQYLLLAKAIQDEEGITYDINVPLMQDKVEKLKIFLPAGEILADAVVTELLTHYPKSPEQAAKLPIPQWLTRQVILQSTSVGREAQHAKYATDIMHANERALRNFLSEGQNLQFLPHIPNQSELAALKEKLQAKAAVLLRKNYLDLGSVLKRQNIDPKNATNQEVEIVVVQPIWEQFQKDIIAHLENLHSESEFRKQFDSNNNVPPEQILFQKKCDDLFPELKNNPNKVEIYLQRRSLAENVLILATLLASPRIDSKSIPSSYYFGCLEDLEKANSELMVQFEKTHTIPPSDQRKISARAFASLACFQLNHLVNDNDQLISDNMGTISKRLGDTISIMIADGIINEELFYQLKFPNDQDPLDDFNIQAIMGAVYSKPPLKIGVGFITNTLIPEIHKKDPEHLDVNSLRKRKNNNLPKISVNSRPRLRTRSIIN